MRLPSHTAKDADQKVGATISDLAAFMVPVGPEAEAGVQITEGAVDLAIPGSEEGTRILEQAGEGSIAQHFADESEAKRVADSLKNEGWAAENCGPCKFSQVVPEGYVATLRVKPRKLKSIQRRGNILGSCCNVPGAGVVESDFGDFDSPFKDVLFPDSEASADVDGGDSAGEYESTAVDRLSIYEPESYKTRGESALTPSRGYTSLDTSEASFAEDVQKTLDESSSAVVDWSPQMKAIMSSDDFFSQWRSIFSGSPDDPLYKALKIEQRDGKLRMISFSPRWKRVTDPALKPFQDLTSAALEHGKNIVASVKGLDADQISRLQGSVEYFWTAPSPEALKGVDPRGLHVDVGLMQFGASDTEGLIVQNFHSGELSRVPVAKDAFQCLKAINWDFEAFINEAANGPTAHTVFDPEMAEKGRVSMIMTIAFA